MRSRPRSPSISFPSHSLSWIVLLPVDFPRLVAMLPSALCLQLSPQVPAGVLNSRGAAISVTNCRVPVTVLVPVVLPRPRSHPNSALSHTPQNLQSFPKIDPYAAAAFPFPLPASTAFRLYCGSYTSPVTHSLCSNTASFRATATTAFFFRLLLPFFPAPVCTFSFPTPSGRCPAPRPAGCSALLAPTAVATTLPRLADPQLRLAFPAVPLFPRQLPGTALPPGCAQTAPHLPASGYRSTRSASPLHAPASATFVSGYRFSISWIFLSLPLRFVW